MEVELTTTPELATDSACQELVDVINNLTAELAASVQSSKSRTLAMTIQGHMSSLRARISELEEFAEEQDQLEDTERLLLKASQRKREYESLQTELRKANLQVRKNVEQAAAEERKALLGSPDPSERQRRLESEADLTDTAQDITSSLQRTRQQMTQELEHTSATLAAMDISEDTLKAAKDEFSGQKASHKRSHQLLGTMRRHSVLDVLTLWGGIAMFLLVVAYIVSKRSLYFVPNFARELVKAPFRPRNATGEAKPAATEVQELATQDDSWQQPLDIPELEALDFEQDEEQGVEDITVSGDAQAGLTAKDLDIQIEEAVQQVEEAVKAKAAAEDLESAHPGAAWTGSVAADHMQAQTAPLSSGNGTAVETASLEGDAGSLQGEGSQHDAMDTPADTVGGNGSEDEELPAADATSPGGEAGSPAEGETLAESEESPSHEVPSTSEETETAEGLLDSESAAEDVAGVTQEESAFNAAELSKQAPESPAKESPAVDKDEEADGVDSCSADSTCAATPTLKAAEEEPAAEGDVPVEEEGTSDIEPPAPDVLEDEDAEESDLPELISETSTTLPESAWQGGRQRDAANSPTTRQEDTEIGLFRPDDL